MSYSNPRSLPLSIAAAVANLHGAASVLAQHGHESAEEILDALTEAVHRWGTPADDLTILVCQRVAAD